MTTATAPCDGCGSIAELARAMVYPSGAGTVVRCGIVRPRARDARRDRAIARGSGSAGMSAIEVRRAVRGLRTGAREPPMWIGWIEFDLLLGDVHSLKDKRAVIRPILADLRRTTEASVAEVADQDLHRRARARRRRGGVGRRARDRRARPGRAARRGAARASRCCRRVDGCGAATTTERMRGGSRRPDSGDRAPSFHTRATSGTPGR